MSQNNGTEEGIEVGENCNRNGCKGIIEEREIDGGCSCHINPPCGYCTTPKEYCQSCGWDALEDETESSSYKLTEEQKIKYEADWKKREEIDKEFHRIYNSSEIAKEFKSRYTSHTSFSMIKYGFFPPSMSVEDLTEKVKGTFGGRFTRLDKEIGRFSYVAYTD